MKRRRLILDGFDTADQGHMTLAAFSAPSPKARTNLQTVPGMDGALDFSEAVSGRPVYDMRTVTATLECSHGSRAERQTMFDRLINQIDGRTVKIVPPDHPNHYYVGRAHLQIDLHKPTYGVLKLEANCEPWRYASVPDVMQCPVLRSRDICFTDENMTYCPDFSSTTEVSFAAPTTATSGIVSLWAGEVGRYGVWKLQLEPNTYYYAAARLGNKGTWGLACTPEPEEWVRGAICTGADGILYLRMLAYTALRFDLKPFLLVKADTVAIAENGRAPVKATADLTFTTLGTRTMFICAGGEVSAYSCGGCTEFELPPGDVPLLMYYTWEIDGLASVPVQWYRGDL